MIPMIALTITFMLLAFVYATAGQVGGSAFVAVMALVGIPVEEIRPTALVVNVVVAALGTVEHGMNGEIDRALLLRLAMPSVAGAALGGVVELETSVLSTLLGILLTGLAVITSFGPHRSALRRAPVPRLPAMVVGASVGFVSGLTGIGGGVFLTPLVLAFGWCSVQGAAAMAPPFILANSLVALVGASAVGVPPTTGVGLLCAGALVGAWFGARFARRRLSERSVRIVLAMVLGGAGLRLLL